MALDVAKIHYEIAATLRDFMKDSGNMDGLNKLNIEGTQKDSPLEGYKEWRKVLDLLAREVGIEKSPIRGIGTPNGLKPDGVKKLTPDQIKLLGLFPGATKANGGMRGSVVSGSAELMLRDFHRTLSPLLLELASEPALQKAADKFTQWWRKYTETLTDMVKDIKYSDYKTFVERINQMADDYRFINNIGTGFANGEHFKVKPDALGEAIQGRGIAGPEIAKLNHIFPQMMSRTIGTPFNSKVREALGDYLRDVKPALEGYKHAASTLEEARSMRVDVSKVRGGWF
jgi:hypothetical protein